MKLTQRALRLATTIVALALTAPAFASDPAAAKAERRKACDEALATLYKAKPEMKARIANAAGYGCFHSFGMSWFLGGAGGAGLVHDNRSKKNTYMNMAQASGGLDFGIKEYQEVLVFKDHKTLQDFITKGWEFGAAVQAGAAADGKGAQAQKSEMSSGPIEVFPMTKTGLAVGAAANARKYWKVGELN